MMDKNVLEIQDKLIRYATSLDSRNWDALNKVFDKSATEFVYIECWHSDNGAASKID